MECTGSTWSKATGGSWQASGNWTGGVPGSSDPAVFNLSSSYTVTMASDAAAGSLSVSAGSVGFSFGAQALSLASSLTLASPGTLTLSSGTVSADSVTVTGGTLNLAGGTLNARLVDFSAAGAVNFTGGTIAITGGEWKPNFKTVAVNADQTFTSINNATEISGTSATPLVQIQNGSFTINPTNPNFLLVGNSGGSGRMILNATASSAGEFYVGIGRDATGAVPGTGTVQVNSGTLGGGVFVGSYGGRGYMDVSGAQAPAEFLVGYQSALIGSTFTGSAGTLELHDGVNVTSNYIDVGVGGGKGQCDLVGPSSKLTLSNEIYVGSQPSSLDNPVFVGEGTFNISNGARVETTIGHGSSGIFVGYTGGKGTVTVDGTNSFMKTPDWLYVGSGGYSQNGKTVYSEGTLAVSNGAKVEADFSFTVAQRTNGSVDLNNATLTTSAFVLATGQFGATHFANGSMSIRNGASFSTAMSQVGVAKAFGTIALSGDNTIWANGGTIYIGNDGSGSASQNGFGTVSIDNHALLSNGYGVKVYSGGRLLLSNGGVLQTGVLDLSGNPANFLWTGGTLKINTSAPLADGLLTVPNTGTLGGVGNIQRPVLVSAGGALAPGSSVGAISTGALTLATGSTYAIEVDINGSTADKTTVTGTVDITGATLAFSLISGTPPLGAPKTYILIDNDSTDPVIGLFDGLVENTSYNRSGVQFSIDYHAGTGNDVAITFTEVPEPTTSLALFAVTALALHRRPRRTAA